MSARRSRPSCPAPRTIADRARGRALRGAGAARAAAAARPDALPLLAVLALPFRLPISTGGRTVNLLIPLYLVVGAGRRSPGCWRARGGARPGLAGAPGRRVRARARASRWLFAARGRSGCCSRPSRCTRCRRVYSADRAKAAENIAFFYVPFALLFVLLREVRWTRELLLRCLAVAVALAVLFAGIGFVEYARKSLFLNPKVVAANQYDNYFRVNSLFFDPNIYGRFLALVMIGVTTVVLWSRAPARRAARRGGARVAARRA